MSVETYLSLSDEELQSLSSMGYGESIEDPFFGSALNSKDMWNLDEEDFEEIELELPDIPISERMYDENFKREDIEE